MQTFSGELEKKEDKELEIVAKGEKQLSKNQQLFNKLTEQIEKLESKLSADNERLSTLLEHHAKLVIPIENRIAQSRIQLAMALGRATERYSFSQKQTQNIKEVIIDLCNNSFWLIEPIPEQEAFFDKWSETTYKEQFEQQNRGTEEGKTETQFEQTCSQEQKKGDIKSKKQLAKEEALKASESLKNKNIRGIYIALAKVLHPDTETDQEMKIEKEELMKEVTGAYAKKDLTSLLKLEMEWVHKTSEHLDELNDDKLKVFISALKQQVTELEQEIIIQHNHPRFATVLEYSRVEKFALAQIKSRRAKLKSYLKGMTSVVKFLDSPDAKAQILEFVNEYQLDI